MNGNRFFLDTNAIIALLAGDNPLQTLLKPASWIGISIISSIEFLAFPSLSPADVLLFKEFEERISVCDLTKMNTSLLDHIVSIRSSTHLKLPDCIILATALENRAILLTRDTQLIKFGEKSSMNW